LGNQSVQVGVGWSFDVQLSSADIIDSFVIEDNGHIGVLQERVGGQNGVVRLNHGGGDLGRWVNGETEFGFLAVVNGESFQQEGAQSGSGTTSDGVEHHEALESGTVVGEFSDSVQAQVNDFFTNGVVASGEVVGGVFLTGDQLFGVEQLSVGAGSDFIDDGGFQIEENTSGDVFASSGLGEEGVEGIVTSSNGLVRWHLAVWLNTMLKAEEFPAGVTYLDTGLSNVD
jgi:hypothetical protein